MTRRIESVDVHGTSMEVFNFEPQGDGPHPGIVQCMHIPVGYTGIENDEFTLQTAQRYVDSGYVVAVPLIFHWWAQIGRNRNKVGGIPGRPDYFRP